MARLPPMGMQIGYSTLRRASIFGQLRSRARGPVDHEDWGNDQKLGPPQQQGCLRPDELHAQHCFHHTYIGQ